MPYKTLQYQVKAEPLPLGAVETSTPDKWLGNRSDIPRRASSFAAAVACAAFVPVVSATTPIVAINGQSPDPISVRNFQYDDQVFPLTVSPPAETTTPDKWSRAQNLPVRRLPSLTPRESNSIPVTPTILTPQVYVQGSQVGPVAVQSFQHDDVARPILITTQAETVTVDKWERRQSQPTFTIKRTAEYRAFVTDNSSLIAPERPSLDKWVVRVNQPHPALRREQWKYTSFFGENLNSVLSATSAAYISGPSPEPISVQSFQHEGITRPIFTSVSAETVTADKWDRGQTQPITKLRRTSDFRGFFTDGASLTSLERTGPDKWTVQTSEPRRDLKRQQWVYRSYFAENLHAVPSTPSTIFVTGQSADPIRLLSFQYPSTAKPVTTPAGIPETITPDKWLSAWPQPYFRKRRLIQYGINCAIAGQADDGLPPLHWIAASNRPLFRKLVTGLYQPSGSITPVTDAGVSQVFIGGCSVDPIRTLNFQYPTIAYPVRLVAATPETVTADKWLMAWPQPYLRKRRLIQYGVNCAIAEQADDGLPPVHWIPPQVQPYPYRRQAARQGFSVTPRLHVAPPPESLTLDKWAQQTHRPRFDLRRNQRIYPVSVSDQLFNTPVVPAVFVSATNSGPIRVLGFQYDDLVQPLIGLTERASLDKWATLIERPRRDVKRNQWIYPSFSADSRLDINPGAEIVTLDKWNRNSPDLVSRILRLRDYRQFSIDPTLTAERASVDKWVQPTQQPRLDLKHIQWLYPVLAIDSQFYLIPPIEIIRLDKWIRQTPDLIFRAKRLLDYGQFSVDPTLSAERSAIDKWWQPQSLPGKSLRRVILAIKHVPLVSEVLTLDKWAQIVSQGRQDLRRYQLIYPPLAIDAQFHRIPPLEPVQLDKWARQYPDLVFRAKRLFDYGQFAIDPTLRAERVSIDRWMVSSDSPRSRSRFIQPEGHVLFVPESVTLDKWVGYQSQPRAQAKRLILSPDQVLFVPESVTLDKWIQAQEQPSRSARRAIITVTELPPSIAEGLVSGKAFIETVLPRFPQRRVFVITPEVFADLPLTEWCELVQPFMPRDVKRNQYFYLVSSSGTDISLTLEGGIVIEIKPDYRTIIVPIDKRIIDV